MNLDWTDVKLINKKKYPYFAGVSKHGNRCFFYLNETSVNTLESTFNTPIGSDGTLNIYEDGHICLMSLKYNYSFEEWVETETCDLTKNKEAEKAIRSMIAFKNIAITHRGGSVSTLEELLAELRLGVSF